MSASRARSLSIANDLLRRLVRARSQVHWLTELVVVGALPPVVVRKPGGSKLLESNRNPAQPTMFALRHRCAELWSSETSNGSVVLRRSSLREDRQENVGPADRRSSLLLFASLRPGRRRAWSRKGSGVPCPIGWRWVQRYAPELERRLRARDSNRPMAVGGEVLQLFDFA
jgi:hypothetical protein